MVLINDKKLKPKYNINNVISTYYGPASIPTFFVTLKMSYQIDSINSPILKYEESGAHFSNSLDMSEVGESGKASGAPTSVLSKKVNS